MISESRGMPGGTTSQGVICGAVLCGILVAGLWPFHAPGNKVDWLRDRNGLRFGDHSIVLSSEAFQGAGLQDGASCSLEIWLQPGWRVASSTFLAFSTPEKPLQFSLRQSLTDLLLQEGPARIYIDNVFREKKLIFTTLTSGPRGTTVYLDGALVRAAPQFRIPCTAFTGQLVVGTSPVRDDHWRGELRGLAIYNRELTASQAFQHYEAWTAKGHPDGAEQEGAVALYPFDERSGSVVHNTVRPGLDLYIPARYLVLHQIFLEPPWEEFRPNWSYGKDILINIAGFVPFGFFFHAYLSSTRQMKRAALTTVILGGTVSLTIEILQAYLPTRNSGMTDLVTNMLGTGAGAQLYRCQAARALYGGFLNRIPFGQIR
jgi:hypothetical protein